MREGREKTDRWAWYHTLLIPALGCRGRKISVFKASLVYILKSRPTRLHNETLSLKKKMFLRGHRKT